MPFNSLPRDESRDDIPDENSGASLTHAIMAGLGAAFSGGLAWAIGWPIAVDMNDPAFNPLTVLLGGALGYTFYSAARAVIARRRERHGAIRFRLDSTPRMGGTLSGVLHLSQPVQPLGEWRVTLRCYDIHEFSDDASGSGTRDHRSEVWSRTQTYAPEARTTLPVTFRLPASVGPKPTGFIAPQPKGAYFSAKVHIPMLRKSVVSYNSPPKDRIWTLSLTAPMDGPDIDAQFPLPIRDA